MNRAFRSSPGREHAHSEPEYATVKATLAQRTDKAILLAREDLIHPVWVPLRAINFRGRAIAAAAPFKSDIEIGVELQFALKVGLR